MQFLVSAGEASGDAYAAQAASHLARLFPSASFYGCTGPKLQAAGVKPIIDASSLSVVGLAEVVGHLPRIYGEYRKLVHYMRRNIPDAALLTDSPDFHLRLARHLKRLNVPVFYLVAPQVWAWRQKRVQAIRRLVDKLFCLFPFEEAWFRERGVDATYIGHPLAFSVRRTLSRTEFFERHGLPVNSRMGVLLPGSRDGEAQRHIPILLDTVAKLRSPLIRDREGRSPLSFALALPSGFGTARSLSKFSERIRALSIKIVENETWDSIGHADIALAASGTVTIEAAVLGTPMVTFYRVNPLSWYAGRHLVKVPYLTMVNLIAGRLLVPELMQNQMTSSNLAREAAALLNDDEGSAAMRVGLAQVRRILTPEVDPISRAASLMAEAISLKQAGGSPTSGPLGSPAEFIGETMS